MKKTALQKKNEFVISLRNYLLGFDTRGIYTFGEGDFEGKAVGNGYALVRRDPNKPKDLNGFCFDKRMGYFHNEEQILKEIHTFAMSKKLESRLDDNKYLSIKFADKVYSVFSHIEQGYAGEITVYFMDLS